MDREALLRRRICCLTWVFIGGLVLSGVTAIPLVTELNWLVKAIAPDDSTTATNPTALTSWLLRIQAALIETQAAHPVLFYGTDWLAFGHVVIAVAFVGVLRDPVRNRWLFDFGLIACALLIPWAFTFGALRGIPIWWRCIDCSFGVFGAVPLWWCRKWTKELEAGQTATG